MASRFLNRQEFINYCFRQLGGSVNDIEITDDDANDIVDDTLDFFGKYHADGSGTHVVVLPRTEENQVEWVMPDQTIAVNRVLFGRYSYIYSRSNTGNFTDFLLFRPYSMIHHMAGNDGQTLTPMWISETFYNTFLNMLVPEPTFRFSEVTKTVILNSDMIRQNPVYNDLALYVEAVSMYSEDNYPQIFSHDWVRRYAVAKMGCLWGRILAKYHEMPTPGGTKVNGQAIIDFYRLEVMDLENEARFSGKPPAIQMF